MRELVVPLVALSDEDQGVAQDPFGRLHRAKVVGDLLPGAVRDPGSPTGPESVRGPSA